MHLTRSHALKSPYRFLDGGGAMAEAIEAHDWSRTPLGPIETWPPVLRIAISTMVNSAFPKCLCWGDTLISIYNDAFIQILGRKHPCLGQPFEEIWREAWDTIGPMTARALAGEIDRSFDDRFWYEGFFRAFDRGFKRGIFFRVAALVAID